MPSLAHTAEYTARGLDAEACDRLASYARMLISSPVNVTAARSLEEVETHHFLDCLELLALPDVQEAGVRIADVGSGGGLPALVLAIALPRSSITAVESVGKKCAFLRRAVGELNLGNVRVVQQRAEDLGHSEERERFDVVVTRAVGSLALVAELCVPLLRRDGLFIAMKGRVGRAEWDEGVGALAILGVDQAEQRPVVPFAESQHRCLVLGRKVRPTPAELPRRGGALRKPLRGWGRRQLVPPTRGDDD